MDSGMNDDGPPISRPAGRVPPHSREAEESVLGAVLLSMDAANDVMDRIHADDFYVPAHQSIFEAMRRLYDANQAIDAVTLSEDLRRNGVLDKVGGVSYLTRLVDVVPVTSNVDHYARIVEENARRRDLIRAGASVTSIAFDLDDEIHSVMDRAEQSVLSVAERRASQNMLEVGPLFSEVLEQIEMLEAHGSEITGLPTGFRDLDKKLAGLQNANLVIVAARPAMGKCLAGPTSIVDAKTGERVTIRELVEDPRRHGTFHVHAFNRATGRLQVVSPIDFLDQGERETVRVRTRLGREIEVTPDHPFLTLEGWRRLDELQVGDSIAVVALQDQELETLDGAEVTWDRIVSVEPVGTQRVYDLSIPDLENFVANDVVVHNSALTINIATNVAAQGKPVALFSLEMSKEEIVQRVLSSVGRVDSMKLRSGQLGPLWQRVVDAASRMYKAPIYIDDSPVVTITDIRAKCRRLKRKSGLSLVVVDYLQLMQGNARENRQQEIAEISRNLKNLARELDVPIIGLSQLNRSLEAREDKRPRLSDLRESGCMPAGTRLLRADTGAEVTLGELVLSQEQPLVWSIDDRWRMVPKRLVKTFPSGVKPVFRLRLASGYEVEATANHKFLTVDGWKPLAELVKGSHIATPRVIPKPTDGSNEFTDDELILLAHLLGDGSIGPTVRYASADPANKDAVAESARRLFGITANSNVQGRTWQMHLPSPYRLTHGTHHPVRNWLEPLGLWGSRSHDKFVPSGIIGLAEDKIALFLRHLWATDGSITLSRNGRGPLTRIYYATNSRRLAEDVRRLLLRLDIRARLSRTRKSGYRDSWHVRIDGKENAQRFLQMVGCHGARGEVVPEALRILGSVKPNPNVDLVPWEVSHGVKEALGDAGITHRQLAERLGEYYCGSYLLGSEERPRRFSRGRLRRMAEIIGDQGLKDLATSDVFWDEVVEITPLGDMPVFDATVEDTHNFVANGVVAHNSLEQDADVVMFIYRHEYYHPEDQETKGLAEVIVAKHRAGSTGTVRMTFLPEFTRFADLGRDVT
jgi:replicative DNA helicase